MHWTQTPEGRRKIQIAQQKAWAVRRKRAKIKGTGVASDPQPTPKSIAKEEINRLAKIGAEQELKKLEAQVTKLRVFLGRNSERES